MGGLEPRRFMQPTSNMFDQSQIEPGPQNMTSITNYDQMFPKPTHKMYATIYKEVMKEQKSQSRKTFDSPDSSAFDSYRQ
jgi:hypothetical protein